MVGEMGAPPTATPHWGGILHSGWVDLETRVRPKDDKTLIAECERGEQATVEHYRRALSRELPAETRRVIERQFHEVEEIVDDLKRREQTPQKQL